MLLAAPLPWLCARWWPPAPPHAAALFLPFADQLAPDAAAATPRAARWRRVLFIVVWALLLLAAARPQWLGEPQPVAATGRRLLLAIDTSGSMAAQDMAGRMSRLQVVKAVAGDFIRRRHGDQIGLIMFGTRPYLQAPLSTDLDTIGQFLDEATIGMAGPATALGDAVGLALKQLQAERSSDGATADAPRDTVLVLLTDGSSNAGDMPPLPAARLAAAQHLRIYTIGVGSGEDSDLDEDTLQAMARDTGGAYFRAADAQALQQAYALMDQLEPAAAPDRWVRPSDEWFVWPLALALLLSVPAAALQEVRWR